MWVAAVDRPSSLLTSSTATPAARRPALEVDGRALLRAVAHREHGVVGSHPQLERILGKSKAVKLMAYAEGSLTRCATLQKS